MFLRPQDSMIAVGEGSVDIEKKFVAGTEFCPKICCGRKVCPRNEFRGKNQSSLREGSPGDKVFANVVEISPPAAKPADPHFILLIYAVGSTAAEWRGALTSRNSLSRGLNSAQKCPPRPRNLAHRISPQPSSGRPSRYSA